MDKWTPSQEQAIFNQKQNLLIEAGAGSGKTAVLVARYLEFLRQGKDISPENILVLTFTKKAASELKTRISTSLLDSPDLCLDRHFQRESWITTIHGFCKELCDRYGFQAGQAPYPSILQDGIISSHYLDTCITQVLSTSTSASLAPLQRLMQHMSLHQLTRSLKSALQSPLSMETAISAMTLPLTGHDLTYDEARTFFATKDLTLTPSSFTSLSLSVDFICLYRHIWERYCHLTSRLNCISQDDLLHRAKAVLEDRDIRQACQKQFRHVMIDECQDTDPLQWEILHALCDDSDPLLPKKLFLVGDLKQAIYRFRGAQSHLFVSFMNTFSKHPDSQVVSLQENFRSTQPIITLVNHLFSQQLDPFSPLVAVHDSSLKHPVCLARLETDAFHVKHVLHWATTQREQLDLSWNDVALLCRNRRQLTYWKQQFLDAHIPCCEDLDPLTYKREWTIDLIMLAQALIDPFHHQAWLRLCQSRLLSLSNDSLTVVCQELPLQTSFSWLTRLQHLPSSPLLTQFLKNYHTAAQKRRNDSLASAVSHFLCSSSYILTQDEKDAESCLLQTLYSLQSQGLSELELLQSLKAMTEGRLPATTAPIAPKGIRLMTMHASKGLAFPIVIIPDCQRSTFRADTRSFSISPFGIAASIKDENKKQNTWREFIKSEEQKAQLQEERRLLYVAMTRAEKALLVCGTHSRYKSGTWWDFILPFCCDNHNTDAKNMHKGPFSLKKELLNQGIYYTESPQQPLIAPSTDAITQTAPMLWQRAPFVTPDSSLPNTPTSTNPSFSLHQQGLAKWGNCVHRALELRNRHPKRDKKTLIHHSLQRVSPHLQTSWTKKLHTLLEHYEAHPIFTAVCQAERRLIEHSIRYIHKQTQQHCRLDLAYLHNQRWTIVDFKTGRSDPAQLENYKHALRYWLGTPSIVIEAMFINITSFG